MKLGISRFPKCSSVQEMINRASRNVIKKTAICKRKFEISRNQFMGTCSGAIILTHEKIFEKPIAPHETRYNKVSKTFDGLENGHPSAPETLLKKTPSHSPKHLEFFNSGFQFNEASFKPHNSRHRDNQNRNQASIWSTTYREYIQPKKHLKRTRHNWEIWPQTCLVGLILTLRKIFNLEPD